VDKHALAAVRPADHADCSDIVALEPLRSLMPFARHMQI
jgi:hypothetical protein